LLTTVSRPALDGFFKGGLLAGLDADVGDFENHGFLNGWGQGKVHCV
jgi:hypothetical protein